MHLAFDALGNTVIVSLLDAREHAEGLIAPRRINSYASAIGWKKGIEALDVATVLVTVKTYPSPSDRYGESVCVAGVRLDRGVPEWVRLYPMKFRLVDYDQQFKKYEIIEIPVTPPGSRDPRPESMRPDQTKMHSVRVIDTSRNWAERRALIGSLRGATTTCELISANNAVDYSQPAPSLGLVKVRNVQVSVSEGEPWSAQQLSKVFRAAQPDLFNPDGFPELEPAPFRVKVKYQCESDGCPSHEPTLLDWETGQAGRKWSRQHGVARTMQMLQQKYETLFGDDRDAHLYVGNLHQYRASFSGLGVWSPKVEPPDPYGGDLFDYA